MNDESIRVDQELRARGVIAADAPLPPPDDHRTPWFIALLQGLAGWMAGVFLLIFLGLVFRPDERGSILLLGAVLLFAAWGIYKLDRDAVFLDQFALALSIAGQFAVAWGIIGDDLEGLATAASLLVLQLLIWAAMPNRTARTLAALFATIAWVYTVRMLLWPADDFEEIFGFRGGAEADQRLGVLTAPVTWLLTWAPPVAATAWLLARESRWMAAGHAQLLRPALTGLLLGLALAGIAGEPFAFLVFGLGQTSLGLSLSWWALFPLLSIALAAFSAYGAFRLRSAGLLGFAILAALLHLARFYYLYGTTLLWKSLIMFFVGAVLLALGDAFRRRSAEAA